MPAGTRLGSAAQGSFMLITQCNEFQLHQQLFVFVLQPYCGVCIVVWLVFYKLQISVSNICFLRLNFQFCSLSLSYALSLSLSLSLSSSFSLSLSLSLYLSISFSFSLSLSISFSLSFSLSLTFPSFSLLFCPTYLFEEHNFVSVDDVSVSLESESPNVAL